LTLEQRLYALPPEEFVAARNEAAGQARAAGDRERARQLAGLRRPTVAAWLVNLLALRRPELVGELLDLGAELREAQHGLRGDQLRELSGRRRAAITALVSQARQLAVEAGRRPGDPLPLAEVEASLAAALADEDVASAVRAGRLTRSAEYAGFGEAPRPQLRVIEGGEPAARPGGAGKAPRDSTAARVSAADPASKVGRASGVGRASAVGGAKAGGGGAAAERDRAPRRGRAEPDRAAGRQQAERDRAERDRAERDRVARETARAARLDAAEAALSRASTDERDAARALSDLSAELDRLRERQAAAQVALREARVRRRAAERDVQRARR
jgi:hypothetical protein